MLCVVLRRLVFSTDIRVSITASAAGVHDFSGSQNGAVVFRSPAIIAIGLARGTGRQLLADIFWQRNATASACIAVDSTDAIHPFGDRIDPDLGLRFLCFQEIWMVLDVLGGVGGV